MKLQQTSRGQYFITLPSAIVRAKSWRKGDEIKHVIDKSGDIVLRKGD